MPYTIDEEGYPRWVDDPVPAPVSGPMPSWAPPPGVSPTSAWAQTALQVPLSAARTWLAIETYGGSEFLNYLAGKLFGANLDSLTAGRARTNIPFLKDVPLIGDLEVADLLGPAVLGKKLIASAGKIGVKGLRGNWAAQILSRTGARQSASPGFRFASRLLAGTAGGAQAGLWTTPGGVVLPGLVETLQGRQSLTDIVPAVGKTTATGAALGGLFAGIEPIQSRLPFIRSRTWTEEKLKRAEITERAMLLQEHRAKWRRGVRGFIKDIRSLQTMPEERIGAVLQPLPDGDKILPGYIVGPAEGGAGVRFKPVDLHEITVPADDVLPMSRDQAVKAAKSFFKKNTTPARKALAETASEIRNDWAITFPKATGPNGRPLSVRELAEEGFTGTVRDGSIAMWVRNPERAAAVLERTNPYTDGRNPAQDRANALGKTYHQTILDFLKNLSRTGNVEFKLHERFRNIRHSMTKAQRRVYNRYVETPPDQIKSLDVHPTVKKNLAERARIMAAMRRVLVHDLQAKGVLARESDVMDSLNPDQRAVYEKLSQLTRRGVDPGVIAALEGKVDPAVLKALSLVHQTNNWGIDGYMWHLFIGRWRVEARYTTEDPETGEPMEAHEPIGPPRTLTEAREAATRHQAANPTHEVSIRRDGGLPIELAKLRQKQLQEIQDSLGQFNNLTLEEAEQIIRFGQLKRFVKKKHKPYLLHREKNAPGYETDSFSVDHAYVSRVLNNRLMDKHNPTMQRLMSEMRELGMPNMERIMRSWWEHAWGQRSSLSLSLDKFLGDINETLGKDVFKPAALERWLGNLKMVYAYGKLMNLRFHMVAQPLQVVEMLSPRLGSVSSALRGFGRELQAKWQPVIDRYLPPVAMGKFTAEMMGASIEKVPHIVNRAMGASELRNERAVLAASLEHATTKLGMSVPDALNFALAQNWLVNFPHFAKAVMPAFQSPLWSTLFMFKSFPLNMMASLGDLVATQGYRGLAKWVAIKLATTGMSFITSPMRLGATALLGTSGLKWMNKESKFWRDFDKKAGDAIGSEYAGPVRDLLRGGIFGALLGSDLRMSLTNLDVPFGDTPDEVLFSVLTGPLGGDVRAVMRASQALDNPDILSSESRFRRGLRRLARTIPAVRAMDTVVGAMSGDFNLYDAEGRLIATKEYIRKKRGDIGLLQQVVSKLLPSQTTEETMLKEMAQGLRWMAQRRNRALNRASDRLAAGDVAGAQTEINDYRRVFGDDQLDLWEAAARVMRRSKTINLDIAERMLRRLPMGQRLAVYEDVAEYMGLDPITIAEHKRILRKRWRSMRTSRIRAVLERSDMDPMVKERLVATALPGETG